tara:strand:- start:678 stop:1391 length:714 start_codon:yes stop_codon:yes gene_type:complete
MISVDTVYQKVLALANKEQRGYITPQEFNLLADKAQIDLYSTYFHDLKMAYHKPTKTQQGVGGDEYDMIEAKLHPFKTSSNIIQASGDATLDLPLDLFYIDILLHNNNEVSELSKKEVAYTQNNPLLRATTNRMVFTRENFNTNTPILTLYPTPTQAESTFNLHYYKKPTPPNWGYVVVNNKALYNNNTSVDFELHMSEEEVLVTRILELSGLVMRSEDLAQAAMVDKANTQKHQND